MKIIYETDRLIVRQWEMKDKYDLFEYASNPNITRFLSFPTYKSLTDAENRINDLQKSYLKDDINQDYAIELKDSNKVIGAISLLDYSPRNEGSVEIGYCLNCQYQGHGYMTEALKGMIKYIKDKGFAKRIVAKCDTENLKSGNVMKRAGMTFEGVNRKAGQNNLHNRHDLEVYSILFEEIEL